VRHYWQLSGRRGTMVITVVERLHEHWNCRAIRRTG
jgi:hypothetical protein